MGLGLEYSYVVGIAGVGIMGVGIAGVGITVCFRLNQGLVVALHFSRC